MRTPIHLLALLALAVASGCGGAGSDTAAGGSITAVATTTQLGDFARAVGGRRVTLKQILPPNADPHEYEPRPSDTLAIRDAALVFESGGDLDQWVGELVESAGGNVEAVRVFEPGGEDPHWWQDPRNAIRAVANLRDGLIAADPDGKKTYTTNAATYTDKLKRLDRSVAACIEQIPERQRKLVTTHDALGYYADRYGLDVVGALIPSLSSQAQPSGKDIEELVQQIERLDVKAIFPENSLNPKLEKAVARETGAKVGTALYADTLGPEGSAGSTYVGSIEANTTAIVEGLAGDGASCDF